MHTTPCLATHRHVFLFVIAVTFLSSCADRYIPAIEGISFNFNTGTSVGDAINIRLSARDEVNIPEWQLGEGSFTQSPVVYSLQHVAMAPINIRVRINLLPPREGTSATRPDRIEFKADGGGILGAIDPQFVNFSTGTTSVDVNFPLLHHTLTTGGFNGVKRANVEWQWKYRLPGQTDWTNIQLSRHLVFTLPREPQGPWVQTPYPNNQNPWLSALMPATQIVLATGSNRSDADPYPALASAIAKHLNPQQADGSNPVRLRYNINPGNYAGDRDFNLTAFLQRLNGGEGNGPNVDCSDCTAIMVALGNIVGCPLYARRLVTGDICPVKPIGYTSWWLPGDITVPPMTGSDVMGAYLNYHEVAWLGTTSPNVWLFDICYRPNILASSTGAESPNLRNRTEDAEPMLPWSIPGVFDYREKLAYPPSLGNTVRGEFMNRTVY